MNCLRVWHLAKVQKDKIVFVPRELIKVTVKTQTYTMLAAVITADYFTKKQDVAAASAISATCLCVLLASQRGEPPRQMFILTTHSMLPVKQSECEIYICPCYCWCCCNGENHGTYAALFQKKPSTWNNIIHTRSSKVVAESCCCIKGMIIWTSLIIWILEGKAFI